MIGRWTLSWYIAKRFLVLILAVYALCMVLIFMIDFVELLRESSKRGGTGAGRLVMITLLRLPAYAELTLPFSVLTGSIGAFLLLSRSSELVVMRAAGMSVWQFIRPGVVVALLLGAVFTTLYNPLAARWRAWSEQLTAELLGQERNLFQREISGAWLRQDSADGPSVMNAGSSAEQGTVLGNVTVLRFDKAGKFIERIEARKAVLREGAWELTNAVLSRIGKPPVRQAKTRIGTYYSRSQVADALGSVIALSFWQLPGAIDLAGKAGRPSAALLVQYHTLIARPFLLAAMVLLAGTVSLRTFRFGKIQSKVIFGLLTGFGFFIFLEVSRQLGVAGMTAAPSAAWVPVGMGCLASLTVLLHQEDG